MNKSGYRGKRKYQVASRFPPPKYAHLWKSDVDFTIVQAGWALLDFCTEYGVMLITFFRIFSKKSLSVKIMTSTVSVPHKILTGLHFSRFYPISEAIVKCSFFAGMLLYKQLILMIVGLVTGRNIRYFFCRQVTVLGPESGSPGILLNGQFIRSFAYVTGY
jgi:hypothetical protein